MAYFFDSSAIIEIINQNPSYTRFKDELLITNALHLSEIYYFLLKNFNKQTAEYWIAHLPLKFIEIAPSLAIEAARFRHTFEKERLSYADCIGFITALRNNLIFLTRDKKFKGRKNVEFVE